MTINKETTQGLQCFNWKWSNQRQTGGFLLSEEVPKKEALAYLKERGLINKSITLYCLKQQSIARFLRLR